MAIKDVTGRVGHLQTVEITTVDKPRRKVEGLDRTGGIIWIPIYYVPTLFRWPKTGEYWVVRQEGGEWTLVTSVDPSIQARSGNSATEPAISLDDLKEGEVRLFATPNDEGSGVWINQHQAVRKCIAELTGNETEFTIDHGLGTNWITISAIRRSDGLIASVDGTRVDENNVHVVLVEAPEEDIIDVVITG